MPKFEDTLAAIYAVDRKAWRQWLEENHRSAPGIWLVYYKKNSSHPSVLYPEAVKEALCFGWIDSKIQSVDDQRYRQIYTPRKPKSGWSKLNKRYVEELIDQGLMTEAGLEKISAAKLDGSWTALDDAENQIEPPDMQQALDAVPAARANYANFQRTFKRALINWVSSAKRPETRQKRIQRLVSDAAENKNPLAP
jgi:uncharacterized protein YdeI (YjbR/CyaY-like superfamily)